VRHQVQGRLVHRAAGNGVQGAFVGVAVFFQPALEQDDQGGLAARRRSQQQQQAPPDLGAGGRGLEIVDHAFDRFVDAEQVVVEQAAALLAMLVGDASRADHVPDVLVRAARDVLRRLRQQLFHELRKRAGPVPGPVLFGEQGQAVEKIRLGVRLLLLMYVVHCSSAEMAPGLSQSISAHSI
jgi:hypothetical protein